MAQLEVLVLVPAPSDAPRFDAERIWQDLTRAAHPLVARRALKLERLSPPSENALRRRLAEAPPAVLHFVGCGSSRAAAQYGTLVFEDSTGRSRGVNTNHLASLLKQHPSVELVVLQGCQPGEDPLGALAASLIAHGVPASASTPLLDTEGLSSFVYEFYGALVEGAAGAQALQRTRDALVRRGRAAPGLKLHTRDPNWRIRQEAELGTAPSQPAARSAPESPTTAASAKPDGVSHAETERLAREELAAQ
jgi:CHAT domain-containing protein